jgi:hypothetical protein
MLESLDDVVHISRERGRGNIVNIMPIPNVFLWIMRDLRNPARLLKVSEFRSSIMGAGAFLGFASCCINGANVLRVWTARDRTRVVEESVSLIIRTS